MEGVSSNREKYVGFANELISQGELIEVEDADGHHRWVIGLQNGNVLLVIEAHDSDPFMNIEELYSLERGKGNATEVMWNVISAADKWSVSMELDVEPFSYEVPDADDEMMGAERLESFYQKFGFTKTEIDGLEYFHRLVV